MVLSKESKYGLTFGQILSLLGMAGALISVYISLNVRLSALELKTDQLEKGRLQNAENIETIRRENRQDHQLILDKLDRMIVVEKNR